MVDSTVGQEDRGEETECKRLFLDAVIVEMSERFREHNSQLVEALCALDPESHYFLDVKKGKPPLELSKTELVEA